MSEGQYVTLGAHEVDDLEMVITHLRGEGSTSTIGIWGRSMGSVTALLYGAKDPTIAGMVRLNLLSKGPCACDSCTGEDAQSSCVKDWCQQ